ncbi:MAG: hypothetical protein ACOYOA_12160 [Saprospiraceae bacterium]
MKIFIASIFTLSFLACDDDKKDISESVNREGAVETQIGVDHLDTNYDVLTTSYKIWKNGSLQREIIRKDTIPALGAFSETDDKGKTISGQKDYELYITVK